MAEEQEKVEQTESQADTSSSAGETTAESTEKQAAVDLEAKLKEQEAAATQSAQKVAELQEQLDSITPYVDFSRQGQQGSAEGQEEGEVQYVSEKEVQKRINGVKSEVAGQLIAMEFRTKHSELVPYEKTIVVPAVARLAREHPTWNRDKVLDEAVKTSRELIDGLRGEGEAKATTKATTEAQEAEEKKKAAAAAGGFASAGATPEKKEEKAGETDQEYMARRQEQSRKARGLPPH